MIPSLKFHAQLNFLQASLSTFVCVAPLFMLKIYVFNSFAKTVMLVILSWFINTLEFSILVWLDLIDGEKECIVVERKVTCSGTMFLCVKFQKKQMHFSMNNGGTIRNIFLVCLAVVNGGNKSIVVGWKCMITNKGFIVIQVAILGLFHGLVIIPVILSFFLPARKY